MRYRRSVLLLLTGLVFTALVAAESGADGTTAELSPAELSPAQILQQRLPAESLRRDRRRPIAVVISAGVWCDPCTWFETFTLADRRVASLLEDRFYTVQFLESDPESRAFPFQRVPTLLVYDQDGDQLLATLDGPLPVEQVLPALQRVLEQTARSAQQDKPTSRATGEGRPTGEGRAAGEPGVSTAPGSSSLPGASTAPGASSAEGGTGSSVSSNEQTREAATDEPREAATDEPGSRQRGPEVSGSTDDREQSRIVLRVGSGRIEQTGEKSWRTYDIGLAPEMEEFERDGEYRYLRSRQAGIVAAVPASGGSVWIWDGDERRWRQIGVATPVE